MAQAATAPAEESDADVGLAPSPATPAPAAQPAQPAVPGEEGRQVIVRPRAPPKPPPAPIASHEAVPLAVEPKEVAPAAVGQKPPTEESDADVGIQAPSSRMGDVLKSGWGGLAEGAAGLVGLPTDISHAADYGLDWAAAHARAMFTGENPQDLIQASQDAFIRARHGDALANALQTFAMPPGAAQVQGMIPGAGYRPQTGLGRYTHEIAAFAPGALIPFGEAGMAARLGSTIAPAIGSETLGHMTEGTRLEPWARMLGAGLGSAGQIAATTGARQFTAPMTEAGQRDLAAAQFRAGTQDPSEADQALRAAQAQRQPGMATGENIPGSRPTTGQVTGDLGQLDMERQLQAADPATHAARMSAQRAAQSEALGNVASGAPDTVSDLITRRLADIDAQHELEVGVRQQAHEAAGRSYEEQARTAAGQVARKGEPEALGEAARKPLAESMARAKEKEKRLWEAIDAHKIGVWTNQVGARARDVARRMGLQKPMGGEEKAIFDAAGNLPRWTRLSDLTDLTSRLKAEMRNERFTNGNTPALKRMTQLLKTSENVIKNAATRQSAKEAQAEMEGLRRMTPEDRANIMAARAATRARGEIERGPAGAIVRQGATSGTYRTLASQVPGKVFAAGPTGYQKLKAYTEALGKPHMDPVHDIVADSLAREATTDGMVDAGKLQRWQAKYSDALRALPDEIRQKFVSGPNEANEALAEGAAARREALIAHNKLDIAKEMGKPESAAMRADPAFKGLEGLTNPRDVQKTIGGMFERKDAVATMTRLANAVSSNPAAADGLKRAILDHVIEKVTSTAEAGTTGVQALKPGMTQSYLTKNRAVLKAAGFNDEQLANFDRIVADIQRQQRFAATKYPGQSNTAQDIFKHMKEASEAPHNFGVWGSLFAAKEGWEVLNKAAEAAHEWTGVPKGIAKTVGVAAVPVINKILKARQTGLGKATDLVHHAVMNPDAAADLLSRPTPGSQARLNRTFARHAMYAGLAGERTAALH
jgi:hypothetical protein